MKKIFSYAIGMVLLLTLSTITPIAFASDCGCGNERDITDLGGMTPRGIDRDPNDFCGPYPVEARCVSFDCFDKWENLCSMKNRIDSLYEDRDKYVWHSRGLKDRLNELEKERKDIINDIKNEYHWFDFELRNALKDLGLLELFIPCAGAIGLPSIALPSLTSISGLGFLVSLVFNQLLQKLDEYNANFVMRRVTPILQRIADLNLDLQTVSNEIKRTRNALQRTLDSLQDLDDNMQSIFDDMTDLYNDWLENCYYDIGNNCVKAVTDIIGI